MLHRRFRERRRVTLSRREILQALASRGLVACRSSASDLRATASASPDASTRGTAPATGTTVNLHAVEIGAAARGDDAIVLLHGWGAPGDDLVSLGRELSRPSNTIFVPAAPLAEGSGRAWWHFDANTRAHYAQSDTLPAGYQPLAAVTDARRAVQSLVRSVHERLAPARLTLAGFSQGAMLALDVALQCEPRVDRVAALSGALLTDSLPALRAGCGARPRLLVTHGRADPVVPFQNAERTVAILEQHGISVDFRPFDGRHEIPRVVRSALAALAFGA
jgi:phospholipase/carboxylesterase